LIWIAVGAIVVISIARADMRFLRDSRYIILFYIASLVLLLAVLVLGKTIKGAKSWFSFGFFSFEPADIVKLLVIMVLAKYFSRRHIEIARFKHLLISAVYAILPIALIMLQPDFGSALVIAGLWLGMALMSGISKRQILVILGALAVRIFVDVDVCFQTLSESAYLYIYQSQC